MASLSRLGGLVFSMVLAGPAGSAMAAAAPSRTFLLTYRAEVTGVVAGKTVRMWLPVPPTDPDQRVEMISKDLPGEARIGLDTCRQNTILYVEWPARADVPLTAAVRYRVTRYEIGEERGGASDRPDDEYLQPDLLVPVDGKPTEMLAGMSLPRDPLQLGRLLYDVVDDHMQYRKEPPGWGRGDAVWACQSGYGNCTDFHSLFISLARTQHLPAKFEMGVSVPEARGRGDITGYHCWAKFKPPRHDWVPVDISEANKTPSKRGYYFGHLDEDRVMFSTGRDLVLTPKQDGRPLNFLIDPYVELDGKPYPAEKVKRVITYEDQP